MSAQQAFNEWQSETIAIVHANSPDPLDHDDDAYDWDDDEYV